jgi:L-glutamine:2-deoxy-scyllo-inosose/3-amino-2,3-dideoxy-scyllo-inosose aminotransferase
MTALPGRAIPALIGGERAVEMPLSNWPIIDEADERRMLEVLRSGKWNWLGEHEREFCRAYAEFIGTRYCLCLSNGTAALQCALQAVGVEPGQEVIVPALTWVATAQAAIDAGADVVLVDIDPETFCIDPESVRRSITSRTKAIVPVHLYGCMCDMDAIMEIAREHDLKVVEDAAHQHGSQWRGVAAGALGDAGAFSFELSKALTCGEGGAITCNDAEVYETAFALKQVGWAPTDVDADPLGEKGLQPGRRYGHNHRITEMQACLLRGGLTRLADQLARREENARYLAEKLCELGGPLRAARRDPRVTRQAYYCLTLRLEPEKLGGLTRDQYLKALQAEWIPVGGTYEPVYRNGLLDLYDRTSPIPFRDRDTVQNYAELRLPNTERAATETGVTLGHVQLLGDREYMDRILDGISKVNEHLEEVKQHFAQQGER